MTIDNKLLLEWVDYVFDHPVVEGEDAWHFDLDAPYMELTPTVEAELYAATFERSEELLHRFTDEQVCGGLQYLTSNACCNHMFAIIDESVDESIRLRAVRSFVPLFATTMRARCADLMSHYDARGLRPVNSVCYMWWDTLPFPGPRRDEAFAREALATMQAILRIEHEALRESALHGLGHWHLYYPREVGAIVGEFLTTAGEFRPELLSYAKGAAQGMVQ